MGEDETVGVRANLREVLSGPPWAVPRLLAVVAAPLLVILLTAPGVVIDPYLRAATIPAVLGDPGPDFARTLSEGTWLRWLWSLEAGALSPAAHLWTVLALWSVAAAAVGLAVFRDDPLPFRAALLAVALVLAPPAVEFALAAPAAVPAFAVVAAFALVAMAGTPALARGAAVVLAPLGMLADPVVPLLLLAILLAAGRGSERGVLVGSAVAVFGGAAIGVLAMFLANLGVHGVFGLRAEEAAAPSSGPLAEMLAPWLRAAAADVFGAPPVLGCLLLAAALAVLFRMRAPEADRLLGGLGLVIATIGAVAAISHGAPSLVFALPVWILAVAAIGWAAARAEARALALAFTLGLALAALHGLALWHARLAEPRIYQVATRALAAEVMAAGGEGPVVIAGSPASVSGAAILQEFRGLAARMALLTGRDTVQCPGPDPLCEAHGAALAAMAPRPLDGWIQRTDGGAVLIRLPDGVFAPAPRR